MKPKPSQPSDVSHIETSHLIHSANQMAGFYMKHNNGLKWVKFKDDTPAGNYMFKVNNRKTKTRCEICSKLTIKIKIVLVSLLLTLNIFHTTISLLHISYLVLVFLLLTLSW